MTSTARVELFGGILVSSGERQTVVQSARASVVVAALVLARGAVVTSSELRQVLWPSGEPASAANQLHRLIGQVRRLFEPELSARDAGSLSWVGGGLPAVGGASGQRYDEADAAVVRSPRPGGGPRLGRGHRAVPDGAPVMRHPLLGDSTLEAAGPGPFAAVARPGPP